MESSHHLHPLLFEPTDRDMASTSSPFSLDQAMFLGFGLEALFYGIYVVIFGLAVMFLTWRRHKSGNKSLYNMLFFACLLFACCTAHFALEFDHLYRGLVLERRPVEEIAAETHELIAADMLVSITDFIAEIVLIYRCWIVWDKDYRIVILPALIALGGIGCAMSGMGLLLSIDPTASSAPSDIVPLGTAAFALPLCFNFIATGLIAGRIWWQGRRTRLSFSQVSSPSTFSTEHIRSAMGVIIESGALYLLIQFVFVVLFAIGHPAQNLVVPIAVQIYGIAPTIIFVRVGLGMSLDKDMSTQNRAPVSRHTIHRPVTVNVSTSQAVRYDYELSTRRDSTRKTVYDADTDSDLQTAAE